MSAGFSPLLRELVDAFRMLPGVGPKTAQRMALHLLEQDRGRSRMLGEAINKALDHIQNCKLCRNHTEDELCPICSDPRRDASTLCIVESPVDVMALEQSGSYRGRYFVLMGRLSPLDGMGPAEIGMDLLAQRVADEAQQLSEVILATNSTVEGEATAHYIADLLQHSNVAISRIAHGVPMGGELEFVDSGTLSHALAGRKTIETVE